MELPSVFVVEGRHGHQQKTTAQAQRARTQVDQVIDDPQSFGGNHHRVSLGACLHWQRRASTGEGMTLI
jgi:hypothetical protein